MTVTSGRAHDSLLGIEVGEVEVFRPPVETEASPGAEPSRPARVLGIVALLFGICAIAIIPRLAVARQMSWLNDEILFVDWLGVWFSQHGLQYIFQWQHTLYPPMSPVFANPPLFPLLVGGALNLANVFQLPPLLAARLVSVIAGALTCGVVAWTGYRLWGLRLAVLAGGLIAVLPVAVVSSATAYVEGLLSFEVALLLALLVEYRRSRSLRLLLLAGLVSGFGILTKLSFLPFVVGGAALFLASGRSKRSGAVSTLAYVMVTLLVPLVCWSGARDPRHIAAVIQYVSSIRPNDGLTQTFPLEQRIIYYPLLVVGTLPEVVPVAAALGFIATVFQRARQRPVDRWLAIFAGLATLYLAFITASIGTSSRHQIAAVEPLLALIAARLIGALLDFAEIPDLVRSILVLGVLTGAVLPLVRFAPAEYNAFSNAFVGGPWGSLRDYLSGDGDGMDLAAAWINANTPPNTVVASVAQNFNTQKYLDGGRRMVPLFNTERIETAGARGATMVVAYASQIWSGNETTFAASARPWVPRATLASAGAPYIFIYDLSAEPRTRIPLTTSWTTFQRSPSQEIVRVTSAPDDVAFQFQFVGAGLHWAGLLSDPFSLTGVDRLAMHLDVRTNSDSKLVYIDLLPTDAKPGDPYLRYILPLAPVLMEGPQGPLNLEIPLATFHWVDSSGKAVPVPAAGVSGSFHARIVVDSHADATGRVEISHLGLVTLTNHPGGK